MFVKYAKSTSCSAPCCIHAALHSIALCCIALHCIAMRCITLHCIALHCVTLHCIALHCVALHYFTLRCVALLYSQSTQLNSHHITHVFNYLRRRFSFSSFSIVTLVRVYCCQSWAWTWMVQIVKVVYYVTLRRVRLFLGFVFILGFSRRRRCDKGRMNVLVFLLTYN